MTNYECPECGGGFPSPETKRKNGTSSGEQCCPWCGEVMAGKDTATGSPALFDTPAVGVDDIPRPPRREFDLPRDPWVQDLGADIQPARHGNSDVEFAVVNPDRVAKEIIDDD